MSIVICFSGGIGSGKTKLSTSVADRQGLRLASFGDFVRKVAGQRGIPNERAALQELGVALISQMTIDGFCNAVLRDAGWTAGSSVVVDGIRHVDALIAIKRLVSPVEVKLAFVDVPQDVRQTRVHNPERADQTDVASADAHSTERDVHAALRDLADLVLDGTKRVEELIAEIDLALEGRWRN